jgi:hypothetical protein
MSKPTARRHRHLVVVVAIGLLLAACGNSGDNASSSSSSSASGASSAASSSVDTTTHVAITGVPGVTDTAINYAALGTNSNNPLGTCVLDCFVDGIQAYFDWRNSEGGVWGRKLAITRKVDDELSKNQEHALEIISANDTLGTFSAAQIGAGWGDLAAAGIPTYVWAINPAEASGHPEIFGNREVNCIECTSRAVADVIKVAGAKKIASLGYGISPNSKACADAAKGTTEKYAANVGNPAFVYSDDNLQFGLANGIGPQVTAMKDAGVDFVVVCIDLNGAKTLAQEMQRQGVLGKITVYQQDLYDQTFVAASAGLFDGDYIGVGFRPFEADPGTSQLKDYQEWMAKDGKQQTEISMEGWINADMAYQGLVKAGPSFDRAKVIAGSNTITDFTAGGLIAPIDWTKQHEPPTQDDPVTHGGAQDCYSLVTVTAGKFVLKGDQTKPFQCWPGDTRDWSEPVPMNFG